MANISSKKRKITSFALSKTNDEGLINDVVSLMNQLWSLPSDKRYVPCPNPSNLERNDLPAIQDHEYVISPKLDGLRFFLLMGTTEDTDQEYSVFINRAYDVFWVELVSTRGELYQGTLLDGELTQTISGTYTYTVFDAVTVEGYDLKSYSFIQRQDVYKGAVETLCPPDGLHFVCKRWYPKQEALTVWKEHQRACDGLILQPVHGLLRAGIQADVFKWKPVSHQTIDFYVSKREKEQDVLLECGQGPDIINANEVQCYWDSRVVTTLNIQATRMVFECAVTRQVARRFFFTAVKPRGDKVYANDSRVVQSTLKVIRENIIVEELCD
jgi:hypothetical protein